MPILSLFLCLMLTLGLATAPAADLPADNDAADGAQVFVQTGNELHATVARFSPDGRWLAVCDALGKVVLWDAHGGRQYREVHRHTGMCMGLAFTPDGRAVISSGGPRNGNEVVLTRWRDGQAEQAWKGHNGQVREIVGTLDSRGAWTLGEADGLKRWAIGQAAPRQEIAAALPGETADKQAHATAMVLSRDQSRAFVGRRDGSLLQIELSTEQPTVRLLAQFPEAISALALAPDETTLAVANGTMMGTSQRDVGVLDAATGKSLRTLSGHLGTVLALAYSPDGSLLGTAGQVDMQAMLAGDLKGIRQHEAIRVWRVADGSLVAEARNTRNLNGMPFTRGSLAFAPGAGSPRIGLALWDETARLYDLDGSGQLRLAHTLEGRGLSPRQLQASDASARLLVTDGRPRNAPPEAYMNAETVRREFGRAEDWTPERLERLGKVYAGRGWLTSVQRAALWDLKTGRLEKVIDWQRAPVGYLGLDDQGRFVSMASLFPATTMVSPLKTNLVREAVVDGEGQVALSHFGFEPWEGAPEAIFVTLPPEAGTAPTTAAVAAKPDAAAQTGYFSEVVTQSASGRWQAVAAIPLSEAAKSADGTPIAKKDRLFVLERGPDGRRAHRHDIALPGTVRVMTIAADERTLWLAGSVRGLQHNDDHEAWLMAIDLADGRIIRAWQPERGITIGQIVAHPNGNLLLSNGHTHLTVWDTRQDARKYHIEIADGRRNLSALALTRDGRTIASADLSGRTTLWDWPEDAAPTPKWSRQLASPAPHLLAFSGTGKRLYAGAVDGSTRVLASADGAEIARMIRFDNDEWISMIPEGYFVASQEGDRWVNVRIDDKVYGVDQFYDVFYRPDIVERKLAGMAIAPLIKVTLRDALRQPPPRLELAVPKGESRAAGQHMGVTLHARDQGGGLGEVRLLHNGKLVEVFNRKSGGVSSAPSADTFVASTKIELVAGENALTLIGFNAAGSLNARPLTTRVAASGRAPDPRVFILAVGIDEFVPASDVNALRYAVKDAKDFAQAMQSSLHEVYGSMPVSLIALHNADASRAGLEAALARLRGEMRPSDLLVWFVASHGTLDSEARYGIVLHDWDGQASESSLFSAVDLLEAARTMRAFNQLIVLDTCHAGGVNSLVKGLYDARLAVLARNMGLHILASANATEEALDGYQGNGLFTHTLLQGLRLASADRNADGQVSVRELGDFARRETRRIARLLRHSQEPLLMNYGKDVALHAVSPSLPRAP